MGRFGGRKKSGGHPAAGQPSPAGAPAAAPNGGGAEVPDVSALLRRAHELKEEGNRLFQVRDYVGALQQYELALKLTPRGHPDRAVFHSNRAACLMQMQPVDHEAVAAECSRALQAQPPRALLRRARALDALHRPDLALQDVQALLAVDSSNPDAHDLARRLRVRLPNTRPPQPPVPRCPRRLCRPRRRPRRWPRPLSPGPACPQEVLPPAAAG